jgi:Ca2+/Na+ antiporter
MLLIKKMLPYLMVCAIAFYMLPLLGQTTGSFMLILLVVIPFICLITALLYGFKQGWNLLYPILVGLLFAPTVVLFYNSSAWVYIIGYAFLSFVGMYIGKSMKEGRKTGVK